MRPITSSIRLLAVALAVALPATASAAIPAKLYVSNNQWGSANSMPGDWQSTWTWENGTYWGWGAKWSWRDKNNQPWNVKGYPSCVMGWNWGAINPASGLPVQIRSTKKIDTSVSYSVVDENLAGWPLRGNVAWDIWIDASNNPGNRNPGGEIMIWTRNIGSGPLGTKKGSVSLAGTAWDVYLGSAGWPVYSYVRRAATNSQTLNGMDFAKDVSTRFGVPNTWYVVGVQQGIEITQGAGRMDVSYYRCDVK